MPTMEVTDEEQEALLRARAWENTIAPAVASDHETPLMYLRLLAAKAELYIMTLRLGDNSPMTRYEAFHRMVSPHDIIRLVRANERLIELEEEIEDAASEAAA